MVAQIANVYKDIGSPSLYTDGITGKPHVSSSTRRDGGSLSQSERDWAWVLPQLREGVPTDTVYADRTVNRALASPSH